MGAILFREIILVYACQRHDIWLVTFLVNSEYDDNGK